MKKEELDAIRAAIASEPEESPARRLLAEIDRRDKEDAAQQREQLMGSLRGYWHLTQDESSRMLEYLDAGGKIESERGACRTCDAEGRVVVGSGCFGSKTDTCPKCDGTGIDNDRMKVPGFKYECTCDPVWWEAWEGRDRGHPRSHMESCPKRRGPVEPKKPIAESEI